METTLEGITLDEQSVNAQNFLGNSLLSNLLNNEEKKGIFLEFQEYVKGEDKRRGYPMTLRQGVTSFFMDPKNRHYLGKLHSRNFQRVLVNTSCDTDTVNDVQKPQFESGYSDHRYLMGINKNREIAEEEAKIDFEENFAIDWAILFRGVYDATICQKGYNCSRAEEHIAKLLDYFSIISEQQWMQEVHGEPVGVSD